MMLRTATVCGVLVFLASVPAASQPASLAGSGPSGAAARSALGIAPADVSIRNLTYLDVSDRRVEATFVEPAGPGPHPAVLFVHWLETHATSNGRTEFLPDALFLAKQGVASLLIETPWSDPIWFIKRDPKQDMAMSQLFLKNLGRALDVLVALEKVDASRLAYVGHDFGAMYGVSLADKRPKAWVYIAGTDRYAEWFTLGRKLEAPQRAEVFAAFRTLDPVERIGALAPSPILFQFANKDPFVTRKAADAVAAAATSPKDVQFYECGHEMNRKAMDDRIAWLVRKLKGQ